MVHATVDRTPWLQHHEWLIAGGTLALAGAFQFSALKDRCLEVCRHPGAFLLRHYERGLAGGVQRSAAGTACSASAVAGR